MENEERDDIITLTDEEGNETDFEVVDGVEYNGKDYLMLIEANRDETEEIEAFLVRIDEEGEDEVLVTVDDEDEFNAVAKLLEEKEDGCDCGCDCGCEDGCHHDDDGCDGECHCGHCGEKK